jgi:hypothetical protein
LFNKDTAGFALIKEGDRRVRVEYENPYISEPSVSASIVFNVADSITDIPILSTYFFIDVTLSFALSFELHMILILR